MSGSPLISGAMLAALLCGCASDPEPMRTGVSSNSRYHVPDPTRPTSNPSNPAIVGESAWQSEATKWIGVPYKVGGNSREGMDVLGLIRRMYQNVGRIEIKSGLEELSRTGFAIPRDQLRPGDIVFFGEEKKINSAGIYIGENRFVHAHPTVGVVYAQLSDPQFSEKYRTARRILR
jgi:cell wall-associated NlpC family hydrolase